MGHRENLSKMQPEGASAAGMDVVIVSTNHRDLESYWQKRLEQGKGTVVKDKAYVIAVYEDYPGGAGNGLGTLYSFKKACEKAFDLYQINLNDFLVKGKSIALYHTAGKGTRTSPLTGSEHNDKSAIKLPRLIQDDQLMTLLEAVIVQTSLYAPIRGGRLSVFWGDQVFIPSNVIQKVPTHHVDILAQSFSFPTEEEWNQKGLSKYGLIVVHQGNAQNIEKVSYQAFCSLFNNGKILADEVGISLGSFSLSQPILDALMKEFAKEFKEKKVKLDSDPHFWMAMTWEKQDYLEVMTSKNVSLEEATAHYERMQKFKQQFLGSQPLKQLFGWSEIGEKSYWWDYGTTQSYLANNLKLTQQGEETEVMREFFRITPSDLSKISPEVTVDARSVVVNCSIESGTISNSVLMNVFSPHVDFENSLALNSTANTSMVAKNSLTYNVIENCSLKLSHEVRADCFLPLGTTHKVIPMLAALKSDGQADWKKVIEPNLFSYEQVYQLNQSTSLESALQGMAVARESTQTFAHFPI